MRDPLRRARMGAAAQVWARERFTAEAFLDGLDQLYRRVLAGRARRPR